MTSYWASYRVESGDVSKFMKNPGPSLRGALGYCVLEESRVRGANYVKLFFKPDRRILRGRLMLRKLKHPPPPFTIPPPRLVGGGLLEIGLRIYGRVGLETGLVMSLFKRLEGRRLLGNLRLGLEEVVCVNEVDGEVVRMYEGGETLSEKREKIPVMTLEDIEGWVGKVMGGRLNELEIIFLTPFKLLRDGKPVVGEDLMPSDLIRYILRRYFILEYLYSGRKPVWLTPSYVSALKDWADENIIVDKHLREAKISVEGSGGFLEGYMKLVFTETARIREVLSCLKIGELIALGKNTSYGCGHYKVATHATTSH